MASGHVTTTQVWTAAKLASASVSAASYSPVRNMATVLGQISESTESTIEWHNPKSFASSPQNASQTSLSACNKIRLEIKVELKPVSTGCELKQTRITLPVRLRYAISGAITNTITVLQSEILAPNEFFNLIGYFMEIAHGITTANQNESSFVSEVKANRKSSESTLFRAQSEILSEIWDALHMIF